MGAPNDDELARHAEALALTYERREADAVAPRDEVDRVARLLIAEWERVERRAVNLSYIATFVDMARVAIDDRRARASDRALVVLLRDLAARVRSDLESARSASTTSTPWPASATTTKNHPIPTESVLVDMPIYVRYHLSPVAAIEAGTTKAGSGYHELTFDDVMRIRGGLLEVAEPYLTDERVSALSVFRSGPVLRLSHPQFPAAIFDALDRRLVILKRARKLQDLAKTPSWENLQQLAGWAEDEIELQLEHAPEGVAAPELSQDATVALVLARWARDLVRVVRAQDGRDVPDMHSLSRLLNGSELPSSARQILAPDSQSDVRLEWVTDDVHRKIKAFWNEQAAEDAERAARQARDSEERQAATKELVRRLGRADQIERFAAGVLPSDEVSELENEDAFAGVPRPDGARIRRAAPGQRSDVPGFLTQHWIECSIGAVHTEVTQVDAETWAQTAPLRELAAQSDGKMRVALYRRADGTIVLSSGRQVPGIACGAILEAKGRLGGWTARQYTWIRPTTDQAITELSAERFLDRARSVLRLCASIRDDEVERVASRLYDEICGE